MGMLGNRVSRLVMTMVAAASVSLAIAGPAAADDLQLLNEWGSAGSAPGQFANPGDLQIAPSGNLVVSDTDNRRIQVFAPDGNLVSIIGAPGSGPGAFSRPSGIAIQNDGTMYAFDNGTGRVVVFDAAGTYVREFLPPLDFYAGVALDPSQTSLYLVDYQGSIIDHVSTAGTVIGRYSGPGAGDGQLQRPQGIAVSPSGGVYVADRDNNRVEVFDVNGGFLSKFGSLGSGPGQLSGPWDVAVMPDQSILVTDANNFRLQHFDASGNFLASYDQVPASPNPDFRPIAVTAAPNGDIYMTDNTTHRILRVRPGPAGATPVLGQSVTASPVSGTVLVRQKGGQSFEPLTGAESVPVGSSVDTTEGRVALTSATKDGETQTAEFFDGQFQVRQGRRSDLTTLALEGRVGPCAGGARNAARGRVQHLWGSGKGHFKSKGRHGAGTVRGTVWLTAESCKGTLFKVKEGVVSVRDFTRDRTVVVRAGERYLAPAD